MATPLTPTETIYVIEGHEWDWFAEQWAVEPPNERVQAAMDALLADFDGARCQMENCAIEHGAPVGWGLTVDDETGADRATHWYTALIDTGTEIFRACEDCHCALIPRRPTPPDAQHPAEALHSR